MKWVLLTKLSKNGPRRLETLKQKELILNSIQGRHTKVSVDLCWPSCALSAWSAIRSAGKLGQFRAGWLCPFFPKALVSRRGKADFR